MSFLRKLEACSRRNRSLLCVGLDPEIERLPEGFPKDVRGLLAFNRAVIEATSDLVCAYKPNLAFYEALGSEGLRLLEDTVASVPDGVPTIGDAKRGDIANTARLYAEALYDRLGFDSVTVNPYLGMESLAPFLERSEKGVWVLCRTSNVGAEDLQTLQVGADGGREPVYMRVLRLVQSAASRAEKGVVVGATSPEVLREIRRAAPGMPLLIPGVGAQGGDLAAAVSAAATGPVVINASRSVLYGPPARDPLGAIRERAERLRARIQGLA